MVARDKCSSRVSHQPSKKREAHNTGFVSMSELQEEMRDPQPPPLSAAQCRRPAGNTEQSWCKAVPGGTGITVLALQLSKPPDISLLQNALHQLQISHPILNSKIHSNPTSNTCSYFTPFSPHVHIQPFDHSSTAQILQDHFSSGISPLQLILEHELNRNSWHNPDPSLGTETDVFFASVYTLDDDTWVVALRLHTSVCDRTTATAMLRELVVIISEEEGNGGVKRELRRNCEVGLGIEDYIPSGKAHKPFWARGVDMLGYSLNSLRLANLDFKDTDSPRASQVVRLRLNSRETDGIFSACKSRGIKLCGVLAAACLIATRSLKSLPIGQREKYAVTTLMDCRSFLDPVLNDHHFGFYHSAILNTHDTDGGESLWELANRMYTSFANAKSNNKHFADMADLNFLMCKAIQNPGLTPSSSLRTALISVFDEPLIYNSSEQAHKEIGLLDYLGCASVHGLGPSVAIFDTIRDGELDCACVYPSPLHSREQMQGLVHEMKMLLVNGGN